MEAFSLSLSLSLSLSIYLSIYLSLTHTHSPISMSLSSNSAVARAMTSAAGSHEARNCGETAGGTVGGTVGSQKTKRQQQKVHWLVIIPRRKNPPQHQPVYNTTLDGNVRTAWASHTRYQSRQKYKDRLDTNMKTKRCLHIRSERYVSAYYCKCSLHYSSRFGTHEGNVNRKPFFLLAKKKWFNSEIKYAVSHQKEGRAYTVL